MSTLAVGLLGEIPCSNGNCWGAGLGALDSKTEGYIMKGRCQSTFLRFQRDGFFQQQQEGSRDDIDKQHILGQKKSWQGFPER